MDGKVLTSKMKGCPTDMDLCDVQVLLDRVTPFATANCDYTARKPESNPTGTNNSSVDPNTPVANTNGNYATTKPESRKTTTKTSRVDVDTPFATKNRNDTAMNSVDGVVLQLSAILMIGILGRLATYMYFVMTRRSPLSKDVRDDYLSWTPSLSSSREKYALKVV